MADANVEKLVVLRRRRLGAQLVAAADVAMWQLSVAPNGAGSDQGTHPGGLVRAQPVHPG